MERIDDTTMNIPDYNQKQKVDELQTYQQMKWIQPMIYPSSKVIFACHTTHQEVLKFW